MKLLNVAKWTRVRARGLRRFVLVNGVLGFGLCTALYLAVAEWLMVHFDLFGAALPGRTAWPRMFVLGVVIITAGGPTWALATWYLSEWLYRRATASKGSDAA